MFDSLYKATRKLGYFRGRDRLTSLISTLMRPALRRLPLGFCMDLDPGEWSQLALIEHGGTEPLTARLFQKLIKPGDTVIDVGAHIGFFCLLSGRLTGAAGTVIGIDPQTGNCSRALNNIEINNMPWVSIVCAAMGKDDGWVDLKLQAATDASRLSLIAAGVNDLSATFHVPVCRLDTLADRHELDRIKLLKIDVEEFELEVLQGAGELISRIDNIIFELLPALAPERKRKLLDLLNDSGFELFNVTGEAFSISQPQPEDNVWAKRPASKRER